MYLFTSEVVSPRHPDKCADIIYVSYAPLHDFGLTGRTQLDKQVLFEELKV